MKSSVFGDVFKALDKTSNCVVVVERITMEVDEDLFDQLRKEVEECDCNLVICVKNVIRNGKEVWVRGFLQGMIP
mgnify:FL=1